MHSSIINCKFCYGTIVILSPIYLFRGNKRNHSSESDEDHFFASKRLEKTGRTEDHSEVVEAPQIPSPPLTIVDDLRTPSRHTYGITSPNTSNNLCPCTSAVGDGDSTCCSSSFVCKYAQLHHHHHLFKSLIKLKSKEYTILTELKRVLLNLK